jgi:hypothetical protein
MISKSKCIRENMIYMAIMEYYNRWRWNTIYIWTRSKELDHSGEWTLSYLCSMVS